MFEVGFSELCMVALVALLVIGPEKLPKIARLAGFWLGKTRIMMTKVKAEINDELKAEEMRQFLEQQEATINEFQMVLEKSTENMQASLNEVQQNREQQVKHLQHEKS